MNQFFLAIGIFIIAYGIIISEKMHRTVVAMMGGLALILFGIFGQEEAIEFIDFNTLGLLIGMMVIVHLVSKTGLFQYLGIRMAQMAKGNPTKILFGLSLLTALASALLDNVTTVLLLTPIALVIAYRLEISPLPFMFAEIFSSNIGGTATLIGDPPNIIIGSAAGFSFMDFITNNAPVIVIIFLVNAIILHFIYRKKVQTTHLDAEKLFADLNPKEALTDIPLLKKSLVILGIVIVGFIFHGALHLEAATVALFGATLLLLVTNLDPAHSLEAVEWNVVFFFVGLFILVGGLEHVGVIKMMADGLLELTGGNQFVTTMAVLWGSGIFSSVVDNIPYTATMVPLLQDMTKVAGADFVYPLWWALSLGACLGGNGSLVGASANLVVAGLLEKDAKIKIKFIDFMKIGSIVMFASLLISTAYLYIRYLI